MHISVTMFVVSAIAASAVCALPLQDVPRSDPRTSSSDVLASDHDHLANLDGSGSNVRASSLYPRGQLCPSHCCCDGGHDGQQTRTNGDGQSYELRPHKPPGLTSSETSTQQHRPPQGPGLQWQLDNGRDGQPDGTNRGVQRHEPRPHTPYPVRVSVDTSLTSSETSSQHHDHHPSHGLGLQWEPGRDNENYPATPPLHSSPSGSGSTSPAHSESESPPRTSREASTHSGSDARHTDLRVTNESPANSAQSGQLLVLHAGALPPANHHDQQPTFSPRARDDSDGHFMILTVEGLGVV
ncbi:hypothetical protein F5878DRAFT_665579 [Lentinula raphanica]|uniref:Uncharacterized protein n=1 Tax=Lentinula raphanica TaxID=153919 RepID=A0AA38U6Z7_9AGAR|nr:hypothetical protein F5878DRAFT_665579 [Lentinula raphanica]